MPERKRLDSQQVELIGRSKLEARLIQHGFEVARPHRDRGIDLIAYRDREAGHFAAVPIQMKASSGTRFGAWRKFGNTDDLIVVYIWHVLRPAAFLRPDRARGHRADSEELEAWRVELAQGPGAAGAGTGTQAREPVGEDSMIDLGIGAITVWELRASGLCVPLCGRAGGG